MMLRFRDMTVATKTSLRSLAGDRKGVTAMEYGVIAAAVVVAIATGAASMGDSLKTAFTNLGNKVSVSTN